MTNFSIFFIIFFLWLIVYFCIIAYREKSLIKTIFFDVIHLYKNFIHWTISKLFIALFSWILGIILSLSFFILFWLSIYFLNINLLDISNVISFIWKYGTSSIIPFLLFLMAILTIVFWFSYYKVLLVNLNLKYLEWEKLPFMKNIYFDFKKIYKYLWVLSWMWAYLLIPIFGFIVLFWITFLIFWWWDSILQSDLTVNKSFSMISLLITIIFWLWAIYLAYRMYFSTTILCHEKEDNNAKYYVKKSIELTKWSDIFIKFIVVNLFFVLIMLPFIMVWDNLQNKQDEVSKYINSSDKNSYNYQLLEITYWKYSNIELEAMQRENNNFNILFYIFSFLFMYWIIEMVKISFYKKEILKDIEENRAKKLIWFKKFIRSIFKKKEDNL